MFIQSGEWVIILRVKLRFKDKVLKSLKFLLVVLLIILSSIPCLMVKGTVLRKYEDKAIAWRIAEIQNQCTILANQLANSNYLDEPISDVLDAEMIQLSNIYDELPIYNHGKTEYEVQDITATNKHIWIGVINKENGKPNEFEFASLGSLDTILGKGNASKGLAIINYIVDDIENILK